MSGDSCINHYFSITCDIYEFFDDNLEVRPIFLDISKTLDKA